LKKITIYLPDDSLAYLDGDEVRADGIGSTELFGALKAAMFTLFSRGGRFRGVV
jgi:hypothetical protein